MNGHVFEIAGLAIDATVTVKRQVLAEPDSDLPEKTWATLADGTPLVTAASLGKGRIILFHVTASADWSNLPLSGLFVEMLRRILDLAPAARHERRVDRFIERMEPWFGGFDRRQRAQIGDWLRAVPEEPAVREAQRRARQDDLLALLWTLHRADLTHDEARQELLAYLGRLNWQSAAPGAAQAQPDRQAGMTVVLRVINTATPAQKAAARKRLQGWRDDIVALMRQSAA